MPCNGVSILTAKVPLNLSDTLSTPDGQSAFLDYLKQAGIDRNLMVGYFHTMPGQVTYVLTSVGVTLRFDRRGITLTGGRQQTRRDDITRLFNAAQSYAALINQQQILGALVEMGFAPSEFAYSDGGDLSFAIEIGA